MTSKFQAINPKDGSPGRVFPAATDADLEAGLASSHQAWQTWSKTPLPERAGVLRDVAKRLRERIEPDATLMADEMGKPITQGRAEAEKCALACETAADHAAEWLAPDVAATEAKASYIRHDSLGPVLAIMPWNFPFWQLFRFGASALAAGNPIVLKHAGNVPGCAAAIADIFAEAGAPRGLLVNLYASHEQMETLVGDNRIAALTLTGSTRAGKSIAQLTGKYLKPSVLELGGSDPFIVLADADIAAAAKLAAKARLQNNGQSCIAAKRFIVVKAVAEAFTEAFRAELAAAVVGDPLDDKTTVGPMAREDLRDELDAQVQASVAAGGDCVLGGKRPAKAGWWYPPTLITGAKPGMKVWDEETFGPVAAVHVVKDTAAAIAAANASIYGLGAALFTADTDAAETLAAQIEAGAVFINDMVRSDPRVPFGGVKQSGWGRELGREGMRTFTVTKTVWVK